jgi:hypothetical protein
MSLGFSPSTVQRGDSVYKEYKFRRLKDRVRSLDLGISLEFVQSCFEFVLGF